MSTKIEQQISLYNSAAADNFFSEEEIKELEKAGITEAIRQELTDKTQEEMRDILVLHSEDDNIETKNDDDSWFGNIFAGISAIAGGFLGSKVNRSLVKHPILGGIIGSCGGVILSVIVTNLLKKENTAEATPVVRDEVVGRDYYFEILPETEDTVNPGENLSIICKRNRATKAEVLRANPEITNVNLIRAGQVIKIPEREILKEGSLKNLDDVIVATGVSRNYIDDMIIGFEGRSKEPAQKAYYDKVEDDSHSDGYLTIGFGHTGTYKGKALTKKTELENVDDAYHLLAQDIQNAKNAVIEYIGKENFERAPQSIKEALIDIAFNKGIELGFKGIQRKSNGEDKVRKTPTQKLKDDLQKGDYVSAAKHVIFETANDGLKRRNIYRMLLAIKDLTPEEREEVLKNAESYFKRVKADFDSGLRRDVKNDLKNAHKGICTGFFD